MVGDVLSELERACFGFLDAEYRTIVKRLLARVAAEDPRSLRRSTKPGHTAAGLVWLALRGNRDLHRRSRWSAEDVWSWFVRDIGEGRAQVRSQPITPRWVGKDLGRGQGPPPDRLRRGRHRRGLSLTIPEGHRLAGLLEANLASPLPRAW